MVLACLVAWGACRAIALQRAMYHIVNSTMPHRTPFSCGPSGALLAQLFSTLLPAM